MNLVARLFRRPKRSATIAEKRLQEVLTQERDLPLPDVTPVSVSFKETADGLCITLGEGEWRQLLDNLEMQLESPAMRDFFQGARVRVEASNRTLRAAELEELSLLLARHEILIQSGETGAGAGQTVIPRNVPLVPPEAFYSEIAYSTPPTTMPEPVDWPSRQSFTRDPVLMIRHSIVAGQVLHYGGTIVILGNVSPAAEVIAERDVIVLGKLRGVAHAGVRGADGAIIAALIFAPTQARIGEHIAHLASEQRASSGLPEIARVHEGRIVVEPWCNA